MAKLSALIPALAHVLGLPEPTVQVYSRHLRAARMISTGGRGPGGAEMTAADCATFLAALLASNQAVDAPACVETCRKLVLMDSGGHGDAAARLLGERTFVDELAHLIDLERRGVLTSALAHLRSPRILVEVYVPGSIGTITFSASDGAGGSVLVAYGTYTLPDDAADVSLPGSAGGDLITQRVITDRTIFHLGALLRGDAPPAPGGSRGSADHQT